MESMSGGLIFAKHSFSISEMEQMAFSPDLKHILRIVSVLDHEGKCQSDLYIYSIDKNPDYDSKNVRLIHHKQHFDLVRFIFSEDGKQLLISADGCIYNFCFDETGIHEGIVITLIELYQTSNIFKTDFVPYDIEPVHLKHNSITLCINRHWLLAFQLHLDSNHSLLYCVTITNDVLCLQYTKDKVYCLTSCAKIYSYNISDGSLSNIFDVYSVLPNNLHFDKFVVSTDNLKIAVYNSNNAVYIVDISSSSQCFAYAEGTSVYRSSGRSGCESVKSYLTNVSRTSTYSRAESVHNINPTSSPTSWISNLEKLRLHYTVSQCPRNKSFVCIKDLPENMFVKTIQFYSYSSLGIWCQSRDIAADNIYRVYDSNTGQLEITEPLHPGTRVIPLNFSGINLDVFAEPGTLSLPLLFTSKEVFINKLLNCVGSDCVVWLLELDKSLSQSMQPLSLLKDALKDSQLHLVKLSLNLQLQELKRVLTKMSSEIMDVTGTTKTVMDQMITVVQDPATKESFNHQILMEALIYANKILSLLQTTNKDNLPSPLLNNLKIEILKRVVYLRSGLRRHQPSPIENPIRVPQWSMWEVLSDKEVVKEGVKELPLVHCFLIQQRHWSSHDITGGKFKQLVVSIVIDYLQKEQLKKAEEFLIRNGYDIAVELPLICSNTLNRSLRDYLIPALGEEYVNAWMFIKIIESILDRYTIPNPYIDYPQGPNAKLTLLNIMSYSSELKTQIITDLYFITRDSTLLKHLDRDICWDYLLSYNSVEGLLVWIDRRQSPLWPVSLFLQWSISQDMIDHILVCDVTDYTKETVLNRLASYGMFLSSEKNSSEAMIRRMANGRLLLQYKEVLKKSTANFCCEDLDKIILKYAVQKDLLDVVIVSGPQTLVIEEEYVQVEGRPDWFSVWKLCCQVSTNWDKETIIKLLTGTSDYLAGGDTSTYLKEHPFVAIAINLLKEKDISRVHAYFSPIIAAMTATEPLLKDATVYSLLAGTIPFYTDNLFQFQPDQHRIHKDSALEMPDFTNEELSKKYGHNQSLRFMDRLKQGRPSQAVIQLFDKNGRIAPQIKKYACYTAHGISLFNTTNPLIGSSCIAFIEMLGKDSELLRTHLACALIMQENSNRNIKSQLYKIVVNQVGAIEELLREIEETLEAQWKDESNMLLCLQQNQLPIRLTALHSLPPSNMILKYAAKSNNWLLFILAAHIFQYPLEKVQELVAEFNCRKLREHLYFAFAIEPVEQCDMDNIIIGNLKMSKVNAGPNSCHLQYEFELFANVAQCNNNAEEMLQISRRVGNPVLALLASSLKPKSVISPFCTWLVVSICGKNLPVTFDEPYTPAKVLEILELTIRLGYIRILAQAFLIYLPENPLQIFSTFLVDTVVDKKFQTSILTLKAFKAACLNLPDKTTGRIIGFMKNRSWIANASLRMASIALAYCFKSPYHQNRFLKVLVDSQFSQHLSVPAPDYYLFTRLSNCLAHTDIRLDYAQLCIQDNQSHLIEQLQLLIERKDFQTAFRFASTAGLSLGVVHIADWSNRAKTDEGRKPGFWSHCLTSLQQALVEPQLAAEFFRNQGSLLANPQDRFLVLKCALEWMKKIPVSVGDEENNVQLDLYLTALQEGFNIQMITEGMTYKPLHYLSTDIQRKSHLSQGVPKLSMEQHYKLDSLIHRLLEVGDIMTVVNLQDMFEHVNQDYELVLACMGLAEGKTFQQLPEMIQDLLNIDSNLSLSNRPKLPASSPRYNKQNSPVINIEEQQRVLNSLYALQVHQTCPTSMFRNIINAYKVATALGLDYKVVITHTEPLSFLHVEDDFEMAGYVFSLAALTKTEFAQYLAEQLISVIHAGPVDGSYMLWGCDLDTQFLRLLDLDGIIPLMLGNLLLSSVPRLDSKQLTTLREAVELIIRSHDCFTKACNMEGISSILTMSGDLVNFLLDCCQWALMVRLLTGVGRYTEMNYIFQILKDRDQFEFLLGKGLDKYPGLMSSMLDFVRYDKPRYMLVAVHFRMYSELAVMFKDEAMNELEKLERGQDGSLVRSDHNKQCLQAAMNKYADATNHYMQANKKKQGVLCIQQAELVALQLCLMITIPPIQNVHCLINLSPDQVTALILSFLSYEQACIVSAAYNLTIDWSAPLYYHCVVQGETSYLNAWGQHNHFTVTIVQDVARRFQNSKTVSLSMETNMKWFLSSVEQVDIKYRICSQLGFKDLLQTILSGPDVAYLKDTVWQRGFKYQHL